MYILHLKFKRVIASLVAIAISINNLPVRALETEEKSLLREVEFLRLQPTVDMETATYDKDPTLREPYNFYDEDEPAGELVAVDQYSKTYQVGERDFVTVIGGDTSTYRKADGTYGLVDNNLVEQADAQCFVNSANDYSVMLPAEADRVDGEFDNYVTLKKNGYEIRLKPIGGDFSRPVAVDNAVLYNDVYDGVDYQYTVIGDLIKEDIILNKEVEQNSFSFVLDANGLEARLEEGILLLYDGDSEIPVCVITAPEMMDASGEVSLDVSLSLDGDVLTVTAGRDWLSALERAYPVRVDPTISISDSAIGLFCAEQGSPNLYIGDNNYAYVGYDDGIVSGNIASAGTAHLMCRTYVKVDYDFSQIPEGSRITNATFKAYHFTRWSKGATNFGLYTVDQDWSNVRITWNNQTQFSHTFIQFTKANTSAGWVEWDVTDVVNSWVQGIASNNGFVMKAEDERNMQAEVFRNKNHPNRPVLTLEWSIPDPVDPNFGINDTTIILRPMTEKDPTGKLRFDGIFADGTAKPGAQVHYWLAPGDISGDFRADVSFKYPDSSFFEERYPEATKYKDKQSNWQTGLYDGLEFDKAYRISATATKDGITGNQVDSEKFLIYKVKTMDTFPFIANHYGVPLNQIMRDNRVQDALVVENNTIFIRNPNTEVAYTQAELSDDAKKAIDSSLMGRGFHCEYGFEPINLNTGNFYFNTADVSIEDFGGAFSIERTYNSKLDGNNSAFGRNWSFAYDEKIAKKADGRIVYVLGDGKILYYTPVGNGEYAAPAGYHNTFKAIDYVVDDVTYTMYELYEKDGSYKKFNVWGLLTDVVDRYGFITSISYDENFRMNALVAPSGKRYEISMDDNGRIVSIGIPNGAVLRYGYDESGNLTSYTDANGNVVRYVYDGSHRMTEWYDQEGNRIVLNEYDGEGRVVRQTNANGAVSTLQYTENQTITTDANGNVTKYTYDDQMRTVKIEYPNGKVEDHTYDGGNNLASDYDFTYTYDEQGNKLSETRRDGQTRYYTYNWRGDVTSITDFNGATLGFTYSDAGDLVSISYLDGTSESYAYDELHRVISHTNRRGNTEFFGYTDALLTSYTDFNGNNYQYSYNALNQIITVVAPDGTVTRKMYDATGTLTGEQSADEGYTEYVLNKVGNVVRIVDPLGYASDFEYDGMYNILKGVDPLGNTVVYTYDGNDNALTKTDALGYVISYQYDSLNNISWLKDGNGAETSFGYDVDGNLIKITYADGTEENVEYEMVLSLPIKSIDVEGNATEYGYDVVGNLVSVTNPDGTTRRYAYDQLGRVTESVDETGYTTFYGYDADNNVIRITDDEGREYTYEYDANGNLTKSVNPLGYSSRYEYDAMNRVVRSYNENDAQISYEYDAVGNLAKVVDALGNVASVSYDKNQNVIESVMPNGAVTVYNYNAIGDLISTKDALGNITNYSYDGIERLVSVTDALNGTTSYSYDALGNVITVTDASGDSVGMTYDIMGNLKDIRLSNGDTTSFEYDKKNRLVKSVDAAGLEVSYVYDLMGRITSISDNTGASVAYGYDDFGRLVSQTDQVGRTETYEYDHSSQLIAGTEVDHNRSTFEYDLLGNVIAYTDPQGLVTRYSYDPAGNQIGQTRDDGKNYSYVYDAAGQLVESVNPLGAHSGYAYDSNGNLVLVRDANGVESHFSYDALDRLVAYTDGNGNQMSIGYDQLSRPISVTDPNGGITEYLYDAVSNLEKVKNANGYITEYQYDILGNVVKEISQLGAEYRYTYDKHNNVTSVTDPLGNVTSYDVNLAGLITKITQPNGGTYEYTYDAVNRLTGIKSPLGLETQAAYDELGNLVSLSDNAGHVTSYEYDAMHRITKAIDAMGNATGYNYDVSGNLLQEIRSNGATYAYTYDLMDQVLSTTDPLGKITTLTYDLVGNVLSVTEPGNRTTSIAYDNTYNVVSVTDPLGNTTRRGYDKNGNVTAITNALGDVLSFEYDALGQLTRITNPSGKSENYRYDAHGNVTNVIDLAGNETIYTYDLADRLIAVKDPQSRLTRYAYDNMGNLVSATDADGKTVTYGYDLEGNLTELTDAKGTTKQTYDLLGNLKSIVNPDSSVITYDYDKLNRLVSKTYSQDEDCNVIYLYDVEGNRLSMSDQSGESTYTYDLLNRVTSVTSANGSTVSYTYDEANNLATIEYPDGRVVSYTYDLNNQLIKVDDSGEVTTYTYDVLGRLTETLRPNQSKTTYTYDRDGKIIELVNYDGKGKELSSFAYTYNEQGYIGQEVATNADGKATRTYEYNPSGELEKFVEKTGKQALTYTYSYDNSGNRIKLVKTGGKKNETITYTYNEVGQLVTSNSTITGKTTYEYDENGSLVSEKGNKQKEITYEYSVEQRLSAIREGGELLMAASYDGDGNRLFQISKSHGEEYVEKPNLSIPEDAPSADKTPQKDEAKDEPSAYPIANGSHETDIVQAPMNDVTGFDSTLVDNTDITNTYYERIYVDPADDIFWYGFGQGVANFFGAINPALSALLSEMWDEAWQFVTGQYTLVLHSEAVAAAGYSDEDVLAMRNAGLTEQEIAEIIVASIDNRLNPFDNTSSQKSAVKPNGVATPDGKDKPESPKTIFIPATSKTDKDRVDYELTHYINDVNVENTQVLMEYGKREELKSSYTYGVQRISDYSITDVSKAGKGEYETGYYLYDGRGSVTDVINQSSTLMSSYSYDAFGNVITGAPDYDSFYGYNAEDTNPVTGLQYLRARYYDSALGRFGVQDNYLGNLDTPLTLNRYSFTVNNPIMYEDPSGHFFLAALAIGAVVGAAVGGINSYREQKASGDVNGWKVFGNALLGGVIGAGIGAVAASVSAVAASVGTAAGVVSTTAKIIAGVGAVTVGAGAVVKSTADSNGRILESKAEKLKQFSSNVDHEISHYIANSSGYSEEKKQAEAGRIARLVLAVEMRKAELCKEADNINKQAQIGNSLIGGGIGLMAISVAPIVSDTLIAQMTGSTIFSNLPVVGGITSGNILTAGLATSGVMGTTMAVSDITETVSGLNPLRDIVPNELKGVYDDVHQAVDTVNALSVTESLIYAATNPTVFNQESQQDTYSDGFLEWLEKGEKNNVVYYGIDEYGNEVYTGITKQTVDARLGQHQQMGKPFTDLTVQYDNLTRNQARAIEQYYIENGPNIFNKINSISPDSQFYTEAMKWAKNYILTH